MESRTSPKYDSKRSIIVVCLEGGLEKVAVDGESKFVSGSYLILYIKKSETEWVNSVRLALAFYVSDKAQDRIIADRTE